jgi:ribulose kinase
VLLGSAVLGAVASGVYPSILEAMEKMNKPGKVIEPHEGDLKDYHQDKYKVFHEMYWDQLKYRDI